MASLGFLGFAFRLNQGAAFEHNAWNHPARYAAFVGVLDLTVAAIHWRTAVRAKSAESEVQFDDEPETVILGLGLHRDQVFVTEPRRPTSELT
jgi:hypothetical protein